MKKLGLMVRALCIFAAMCFLGGCEDDGGGGGSGSQDIGDNNADVIVALGDSITHGTGIPDKSVNYPNQLSGMIGKTVIDQGMPGAEAWQGLAVIDELLAHNKPGYVLIMFGINDLISGRSADSIKEDVREMINRARDNKTIPVIATLTPTFGNYGDLANGVQATSQAIRELGGEEGVAVADVADAFGWRQDLMTSDGLHPNEAGATVIAETFKGAL